MVEEILKEKIRTVPNWPKKDVMFRDITTLLKDPVGLKICLEDFHKRYKDMEIDVVVGIDSRGFILGGALAYMLEKGFVPIRKEGKLPADTHKQEYELEYGTDVVEIHKDAIESGKKVLIVDDLLATGGTMLASAHLVKKSGGDIVECAVIVDLPDIGGSKKLEAEGLKLYSQTRFEGE